jgi:hypothetical protein
LCIVQDDPDDWEAEAAKMATVYRSSYLTLAALHSPNSQGGFFSSRYTKMTESRSSNRSLRVPTESRPIQHRGVANIIHTTMTRLMPSSAHSLFTGFEPNDTPLGSRGWALQERLMAPRTLYFHYEELVWECQACLACECRAMQRSRIMSEFTNPYFELEIVFCTKSNVHLDKNSTRDTVLREWLRLVTVYSTLKLSKRSDVLPALSGLARHFSELKPLGVYADGIWSCDLTRSLVWEKKRQNNNSHKARLHTSTLYDEGMPSWSWVSIISGLLEEQFQVSYEAVLIRGFIQDDHFDVAPEGSWGSSIQDSYVNAFSLPSGKRIRVSGLVITTKYYGLRGIGPRPALLFKAPGAFPILTEFSPDADLRLPGPYQTFEGGLLSCVLAGRTENLQVDGKIYDNTSKQLVLVLKESKEQGVFRRVGFLELSPDKKWFENTDVATIVIM